MADGWEDVGCGAGVPPFPGVDGLEGVFPMMLEREVCVGR